MKIFLVIATLFFVTPHAQAEDSIKLSANDARMMIKILKLIGVQPTAINPETLQYSIAQTDCTITLSETDRMPHFQCTSSTVITATSQEIAAAALYEGLMEAGVPVDPGTKTMSVASVNCSIDANALDDSNCDIVPAPNSTPAP